MKLIQKEFMIFISALLFCYIAHKLDSYNVMTMYLLVRIWIEIKDSDD